MTYFKTLLLVILFLFISFNSFSEKMIIAVLDLKSEGVPSIVKNAVSDIIRSEFVNIANFRVIERAQIDEVIKEQKLALSGIVDEKSAVKIGELTSAQKVVLGEINQLGDEVVITLRIVNVETGESEFSARDKAVIDKIDEKAVEIARTLAQKIISGNKEFFSAKSKSGYYLRSIVPGWGQFYADKPINGIICLSLFSGAVAYSVYSYMDYSDKKDAYESAQLGDPDFNALYDDYDSSSKIVNYAILATGAAYLINWIDIFFISRPDFDGKKEKDAEAEKTSLLNGLYINLENTGFQTKPKGVILGYRHSF